MAGGVLATLALITAPEAQKREGWREGAKGREKQSGTRPMDGCDCTPRRERSGGTGAAAVESTG